MSSLHSSADYTSTNIILQDTTDPSLLSVNKEQKYTEI